MSPVGSLDRQLINRSAHLNAQSCKFSLVVLLSPCFLLLEGEKVVGYEHVPLAAAPCSSRSNPSCSNLISWSRMGCVLCLKHYWCEPLVLHLLQLLRLSLLPLYFEPFLKSGRGGSSSAKHAWVQAGVWTQQRWVGRCCRPVVPLANVLFSPDFMCMTWITQVGVRYFCQVRPKPVEKTRESPRTKLCHHLCNIRQLCLGKRGDLAGEKRHAMGSLRFPWLYAPLFTSLVQNPTSAWNSPVG